MGRFLSVAAALLVLAPSALAAWSVHGYTEPDTPEDATGGHMFSDPFTDAVGERVYFNVLVRPTGAGYLHAPFLPQGAPVWPPAPGSRIPPPGSVDATAYLGLWKDCNGDGAIGMLDTALLEYPTVIQDVAAVCPEGTWHHGDGRVTEFVWIAPCSRDETVAWHPCHDRETALATRVHTDPEAAVWGDFGDPGAPHGLRCPPGLQRGATESTGGLLASADCYTGFSGTHAVNVADEDGSLGLRFEDPHHPEKDCGSRLNQMLLWGPYPCPHDGPDLGNPTPMFRVWDCDAVTVRDPTAGESGRGDLEPEPVPSPAPGMPPLPDDWSLVEDDDGRILTLPYPDPSVDPAGSPNHGAYLFFVDTGFCPRFHASGSGFAFDLARAVAFGSAFLVLAPLFAAPNILVPAVEQPWDVDGPKRRTDFAFGFQTRMDIGGDPMRGASAGAGVGRMWQSESGAVGQAGPSLDHLPPAHALPVRGNLEASGPEFLTFYARVGPETLAFAQAPRAGTYGAEACGTAGSGVQRGWDCDDTAWNRAISYVDFHRGIFHRAAPGMTYQLRDVDCLDGTLTTALDPLGAPRPKASLVDLSDDPPCRDAFPGSGQ